MTAPAFAPPPRYRFTVAWLSVGQIVCWAALYYAFTAFVLPMRDELGWSEPTLMGAYTLGLTTVLVCIGPAQMAGCLVFAVLADRFDLRPIGMATLAGMPLGCLLFALGQGMAALLLFALLFGMANVVSTLLRGGLLPDYFGRAALGRTGGAMSGIAQFARAVAPLASAWLFVALPGHGEPRRSVR